METPSVFSFTGGSGANCTTSLLPVPPQTGGRKSRAKAPTERITGKPGSSDRRGTPLSKVDPSFKSKRYRDKLRTEIKGLESLLPVDRTAVHRKLDSQTVFRLSIGYFRTKLFMQAAGLRPVMPKLQISDTCAKVSKKKTSEKTEIGGAISEADNWENTDSLLQALDGYMLAVTSDGTILYVSENILQHLGFNQVDLVMRCMYGIVHPDDHQELKVILEQTLNMRFPGTCGQARECCTRDLPDGDTERSAPCRTVSFLCRMKCFNGTTTGYLKMHCTGHMRSFPYLTKSQRTSNQVLFAFCRPFLSLSTDPAVNNKSNGFWTKHELDLKFKQMEPKVSDVLGHDVTELEGTSFYRMLHPEDLIVFRNCHKALIHSEEIQTMYFRVQHKDGSWVWLHTRGKVVMKNSKKYSIIFTHCPVKEEDSTYIQQEAILRQRHSISELMYGRNGGQQYSLGGGGVSTAKFDDYGNPKDEATNICLHDPHGQCPSSWHTAADRHSPVFPQHHLPHQPHQGNKRNLEEAFQNHDPSRSSQTFLTQPEHCQPASYNPHYNPLSWWNLPVGRSQNLACEKPVDSYWTHGLHSQPYNTPTQTLNSMRKEYYMHFNGVGFASHDVTPFKPQYPASTLFIQGHVTAYESENGGADQCLSHFPQYGQYPNCGERDCAYNVSNHKGMYNPYSANDPSTGHSEQPHWEIYRRTQHAHLQNDLVTCSAQPIVKQELTRDSFYGSNHATTYNMDCKDQHHYSELISASDFPEYSAVNNGLDNGTRTPDYANL